MSWFRQDITTDEALGDLARLPEEARLAHVASQAERETTVAVQNLSRHDPGLAYRVESCGIESASALEIYRQELK